MTFTSTWIIHKRFDLAFFILPVFLGLAYFALVYSLPQYATLLTIVVWMLFAQTHFGSTWFIYFDKINRAHYYKNPGIYYITPLALFAGALMLGYAQPLLLSALVSAISLYHVTKQNIGILQLYRVRSKDFDPHIKKIENATVFSATFFFGGYGALHLAEFQPFLAPVRLLAEIGVWVLFISAVIGFLGVLYFYLRKETLSLPRASFFALSMLMYSPYLYIALLMQSNFQMETATLTALLAHYMQYLGLVWLMQRNKYRYDSTFGTENPFLATISQNLLYGFVLILGYAALMAYFRWIIPSQATSDTLVRVVPHIVLAFTLVHFYIDSFIWRFRDPFIKETVAPFIKPTEAFRT